MTDNTAVRPPTDSAKPLKPRDAATLIILDRKQGEPRMLMGRRRMDVAFMAGKFVFPGGRVDKTDRDVTVASHLRDGEVAKLLVEMKGTPSAARARAIALAAVRETFEEAGLVIGTPLGDGAVRDTAGWTEFLATGFAPALGDLIFFARAITPPGRPRRFDTRFFCVDADAISRRLEIRDGELSALDWITLEEARALDLPNITRVILEDLHEGLAAGTIGESGVPVPFYHVKNGSSRRDTIVAP